MSESVKQNPNQRKINVKDLSTGLAVIAVSAVAALGPNVARADAAPTGGSQAPSLATGGKEAPVAKTSHKEAAKEKAHERKLIKQLNAEFTFNVQDGEPASVLMGTVVRHNKANHKPADGVTFPGMNDTVVAENPFVGYDNSKKYGSKTYIGILDRDTATVHFRAMRSDEDFVRNEELTQIAQEVVFPQQSDGLRDFNHPLQTTDNFGNTLDDYIDLKDPGGNPYVIAQGLDHPVK
jgi:hypothetical protein